MIKLGIDSGDCLDFGYSQGQGGLDDGGGSIWSWSNGDGTLFMIPINDYGHGRGFGDGSGVDMSAFMDWAVSQE